MKRDYPLAAVAAVVLGLSLCASAWASETDNRIESAAHKSHVFKTYLKDDNIKVQSKDGLVTLTGTVAEESHKFLAEHTVEGLPGVKNVENRIEVKGERPDEHSDKWIATKVKGALMFHRNVSGTKTEVDVANGVVTLRGETTSLAQKELTAEYARGVEGVKDVKNEMTVAKAPKKSDATLGEKIDDASINAQTKWALLSHRSTSALQTKVETKDGVVTLSGKAKNAAEKDLVTKLVSDINGVKKVVNNMRIESALKT